MIMVAVKIAAQSEDHWVLKSGMIIHVVAIIMELLKLINTFFESAPLYKINKSKEESKLHSVPVELTIF